jgi:hypothetical protein
LRDRQVLFEADFEENDRQETAMKFLEEALRLENPTNVNSRTSGLNRRRLALANPTAKQIESIGDRQSYRSTGRKSLFLPSG